MFNEVDMLELRLMEMSPVVDYFIIIESNITHSKLPKPLHFLENQHRFEPYLDRIFYVYLQEDYLLEGTGHSHWDRETKQRNAVVEALSRLKTGEVGPEVSIPMPQDDDLVLIADIDEIIRRHVIEGLRECEEFSSPTLLHLDWYLYSVLWKASIPWGVIAREGPVVVTAGFLLAGHQEEEGRTASAMRRLLRPSHLPSFSSLPIAVIQSAGWHFSSFGGPTSMRDKLISYADHVYEKGFLLDMETIERLQHYGVPYFFMAQMEDENDNLFLPNDLNSDSLPLSLYEDPSLSIRHLLFGDPNRQVCGPSAATTPSRITDVRWLRQDLLKARYYLSDTKMSLVGVKERSSITTLRYTCGSVKETERKIQMLCKTLVGDVDCHGTLSDNVAQTCASSPDPSVHRSLAVKVADSQLASIALFNTTFIVEVKSGDTVASAAARVCEDFGPELGTESCLKDVEESLWKWHDGNSQKHRDGG